MSELHSEGGEENVGEVAEGAVELLSITAADEWRVVVEAIDEEDLAEAVALEEAGECVEGDCREHRLRELGQLVEGDTGGSRNTNEESAEEGYEEGEEDEDKVGEDFCGA